MKKIFILSLLLSFALYSFSEVYTYQATSFANRYKENGIWTNWSEWEDSKVKIILYADDQLLYILTKAPQIYRLYKHEKSYYDSTGGYNIIYRARDQDSGELLINLRRQKDGQMQLYVEYSDLKLAYNVRPL